MGFWKTFLGFEDISTSLASTPPKVTSKQEQFERVMKLYIDHGYIIATYSTQKPTKLIPYKNETTEQYATRIAESIYEFIKTEPALHEENLKSLLNREETIERLVKEAIDSKVEVLRSKVMVMMVQAGLTHSDIFLKVVQETKLKNLEKIERWVLRSDAYKNNAINPALAQVRQFEEELATVGLTKELTTK